ncbi:hypothetical protein [Streptomyces sp. NEAU-NA10]
MDVTPHASFLPHDDPDAGVGVRHDTGHGGMLRLTVVRAVRRAQS